MKTSSRTSRTSSTIAITKGRSRMNRRANSIRRAIMASFTAAALFAGMGIVALAEPDDDGPITVADAPYAIGTSSAAVTGADAAPPEDDVICVILSEPETLSAEGLERMRENSGIVRDWPKTVFAGEFEITAYCSCEICCGRWAEKRTDGIVRTADGSVAEEGVTVAVDPSVIPLGTRISIDGLGDFIAQDTGAAIHGNKIDVYMDSHEAAKNFAEGKGRCRRDVWIIEG